MAKKATKKINTNPSLSQEAITNIDSWKFDWLNIRHLSLFGIIIYFQSINYDYVLDDVMMIKDNKFTNEGFGGIIKHLTNESMTGYFGEQKNLLPGNRYRPLSLVTFSIEKGIFGKLSPALGHFNNMVLYALSGILIFVIFQILFSYSPYFSQKEKYNFIIPSIIAVSFVAHPLHVEAVANIKGRDEILSLLFAILALLFFVKNSITQKNS
ncbi:MAG TPA: hypothetical protein PKD85_14155, partial [Saprospiraceae bacterium]|nr:hypothetical protein [Saprospiraceae bacterium]